MSCSELTHLNFYLLMNYTVKLLCACLFLHDYFTFLPNY